jgi:hypothetical protein
LTRSSPSRRGKVDFGAAAVVEIHFHARLDVVPEEVVHPGLLGG